MDPITVTVKGFIDLTGLGRTKAYELIKSGEIEKVAAAGRTLITYDSIKTFIERAKRNHADRSQGPR